MPVSRLRTTDSPSSSRNTASSDTATVGSSVSEVNAIREECSKDADAPGLVNTNPGDRVVADIRVDRHAHHALVVRNADQHAARAGAAVAVARREIDLIDAAV